MIRAGSSASIRRVTTREAVMESIQHYTRDGEYKGIGFDVEIWQFDTGEIAVQAVYVDGFPSRRLSDGHREEFNSVQEAFEYGSKLARELIDHP
ncbi:hypothetical protein [Stenotrophomonas sp. B1-1]|uniref:hypothetical protein n=1 Tax=Stenotrophomonas sp. B1-1 TaxID=2710648 RepID=UPI0013DAF483|nr:hypothetical protein [Stenotrophomonas sp. B1-1]